MFWDRSVLIDLCPKHLHSVVIAPRFADSKLVSLNEFESVAFFNPTQCDSFPGDGSGFTAPALAKRKCTHAIHYTLFAWHSLVLSFC